MKNTNYPAPTYPPLPQPRHALSTPPSPSPTAHPHADLPDGRIQGLSGTLYNTPLFLRPSHVLGSSARRLLRPCLPPALLSLPSVSRGDPRPLALLAPPLGPVCSLRSLVCRFRILV